MQIREATRADLEHIHCVHWAAFPEGEREVVARLAGEMLLEESSPRILSLVAESDGEVVGHVAFSPVRQREQSEDLVGYILAPLAVKPEFQKRGVGSNLIEQGKRLLAEMGVEVLLVYGDPAYYGRFGFDEDFAKRYVPPYALKYAFGWQGMRLSGEEAGTSPVEISCVSCLSDASYW